MESTIFKEIDTFVDGFLTDFFGPFRANLKEGYATDLSNFLFQQYQKCVDESNDTVTKWQNEGIEITKEVYQGLIYDLCWDNHINFSKSSMVPSFCCEGEKNPTHLCYDFLSKMAVKYRLAKLT